MGRYFEALDEINIIRENQLNEVVDAENEISSIKQQIQEKEKLISWKKLRAKVKPEKDILNLCYLILLGVSLLIVVIAIVALLLPNGVNPSKLGLYILLKRTFKATAYKKAFWSVLTLVMCICTVNNLTNVILNIAKVFNRAYRHIQRIVFLIIQLIVVSFAINKFNASMYGDTYKTLKDLFDFTVTTDRKSHIVFSLLFFIGIVCIVSLISHLVVLIIALVHDIKAKKTAELAKDEVIALQDDVAKSEAELDELLKKHKNDVDIAIQLADALKQKGVDLYESAMQGENVDIETIKKAIEYDNPDACYQYCKYEYVNAVTDEGVTNIEFDNTIAELNPYAELALEGSNKAAAFLYVLSKVLNRDDNVFTMAEYKEFLNMLMSAKKSKEFDEFFIVPCAELINSIDENIKSMQQEAEEEKRRNQQALRNRWVKARDHIVTSTAKGTYEDMMFALKSERQELLSLSSTNKNAVVLYYTSLVLDDDLADTMTPAKFKEYRSKLRNISKYELEEDIRYFHEKTLDILDDALRGY